MSNSNIPSNTGSSDWDRVWFFDLARVYKKTIVQLWPHVHRPGVAGIVWRMCNSLLCEAESFNREFPKARPIGPDEFTWILEVKRTLLIVETPAELMEDKPIVE